MHSQKRMETQSMKAQHINPQSFLSRKYSCQGIRFCSRLMGRYIDNRAGTANLTT